MSRKRKRIFNQLLITPVENGFTIQNWEPTNGVPVGANANLMVARDVSEMVESIQRFYGDEPSNEG